MPEDNNVDNTNQNLSQGNSLDREIAAFEGVHAVSNRFNENQQSNKSGDKTNLSQDKSTDRTKEQVKTEVDKTVLPPAKQGTKESQVDKSKDKSSSTSAEGRKEVNIEAFDKILNPNKEFIKTKEDKKIKDDEVKIDNETEVEIKPKERDLEGFGEQEKIWLKRMPYEAYEYFSKTLRESRKLDEDYKTKSKIYEDKIKVLETGKQVLPESYYENENAFVLSPEFNNLQTYVQTAKAVESHWSEQLALFEKGENWTTLVKDPKTGEIVLGEEREYNADDKVYLLKQLHGSSNQLAEWQNEANRFIGSFKERHQNYIKSVNENREKMLPVFKDKESVEYKTYEAIKPTVEKWGINKNNPAFDFLAQAVALNLVFRDALTSILTEKQKAIDSKEEQRLAGPTMNNLSGGSSSANGSNRNKEVSMADFDKILSPGKYL